MRIVFLTVMILFATSASAGLYKWVDDDGNVHYSQKRPLDKQYKKLKAPPPPPEDSKPLYPSSKPQDTKNNTVAAELEKNQQIRAKNCEQAKKDLANFQIYRRFRDKDGNVTVIDDKVRAQNIEKAKNAIESFCN